MNNKVLVVIDLQNDLTKNHKEIIGRVNRAADWAVTENMPVIYIQHNNISAGTRTFKPGTHEAEFVPELKIVSEYIFTKKKSNAPICGNFADFIRQNGITEFFIAGADATVCIESTCYNVAKSDYTVHVLSDCITSYDQRKINEMIAYYESKGCLLSALGDIV